MCPVLFRVGKERRHAFPFAGERGASLGVGLLEAQYKGIARVFAIHHRAQPIGGFGLGAFGQLVEHIDDL
jgi:hypothetical protein